MQVFIPFKLVQEGRSQRGDIGACPPAVVRKYFVDQQTVNGKLKLYKNTANVFCLFSKSTCIFVSSFWGLRLQTPTEALPLDPAREFCPPDLPLVPPLANSWLCPCCRSYGKSTAKQKSAAVSTDQSRKNKI